MTTIGNNLLGPVKVLVMVWRCRKPTTRATSSSEVVLAGVLLSEEGGLLSGIWGGCSGQLLEGHTVYTGGTRKGEDKQGQQSRQGLHLTAVVVVGDKVRMCLTSHGSTLSSFAGKFTIKKDCKHIVLTILFSRLFYLVKFPGSQAGLCLGIEKMCLKSECIATKVMVVILDLLDLRDR